MTARILVVDDIPVNTRLMEAKLLAEYYQVSSARDGVEALSIAHSWQPDLILLDVMMPGMDGYECCRLLKASLETLHIPVVMITALGDTAERNRGLECGADDFLTKPVDNDILMARIRSVIPLKRLLDEWRARGATARSLGLASDSDLLPSVDGAQVLVIDDWAESAEDVRSGLAKEGFVSVLADGRSSALSLLEAVTFDLIVISLSLLNDDPLSIIATLRASDKSHETPLLLLADFGEKERILRGFQLGVNDCVSFPIDVNELRLRCRNQIRRKFYQDRLRLDVRTALEMALTDPLTGLYNQRYLRSHLLGLIKDGRGPDISVLMIDVDHFKSINDQNGHAFGDHSLKLIAHALRVNTRVFDTVARYGGEEFVVVMPSTGFLEAADSAERLRKSVEEIKFDAVCKNQVKLTVSIGVVCNEGAFKALSAEMLLQNADKALYEAKRTGRNKVVMYVEPLASDRENI